jgi:hypothetical protein
MTVQQRIANAVRDLIERGGPAGVREPRRPSPSSPPDVVLFQTGGPIELTSVAHTDINGNLLIWRKTADGWTLDEDAS